MIEIEVNKQYETSEYVVCYIDILGAKEFMKNPDSLKIIHNAFEDYKAILPSFNNKLSQDKFPEVGIRIFSDNIVLFCPVNENKRENAYASIIMSAFIVQSSFLNRKILVRGGISCGDFFVDDIMIWGEALVKAYTIESTIAIYPRIVIDDSIEDDLLVYLLEKEKLIKCEFDGTYVCDSLRLTEHADLLFLVTEYLKHAQEKIKEYRNNQRVKQKWEWQKNYLENCIKDIEGKNEKQ